MKMKVLAMILAALMLSAVAVVPAYADTAAAVPAGTDLFADKNPGLEDATDGAGGWEKTTMKNCIAEHDKDDANYREEFGNNFLSINADHAGTTSPIFRGMEGGRHYYLSFWVRRVETRNEGLIHFDWGLDGVDYQQVTDIGYHWPDQEQCVGVNSPENTNDDDMWRKLTYDIIIPPQANEFSFVIGFPKGKTGSYEVDNFSLIAGEYITDNLLRNGSFDATRGFAENDGKNIDPIFWDTGSYYSGYTKEVADGNGGYYYRSTSKGSLYTNVQLTGGKLYALSFKYQNGGNAEAGPKFSLGGILYESSIKPSALNKWETYTAYLICNQLEDGVEGTIKIEIGASSLSSIFMFDDVVLKEVTDPVKLAYLKDGAKGTYDTTKEIIWQRGTEATEITDFTVVSGVHPVSAYAYHFPKAAGEKASLISAVYKENNGVKQLVNVKVTAVTAADTNPVALTHTIDVKEADADSVWVESFVWTDMTKLAPIANSVYTLGK